MPVDEPRDVLQEVLTLGANYAGPKPWRDNRLVRSNPIKLRASYDAASSVFAHSKRRMALSEREGSALRYALRSQEVEIIASSTFSRFFNHRDGRELVLENGVMSDLLAVGAISHSGRAEPHEFLITGFGESEINRCFAGPDS